MAGGEQKDESEELDVSDYIRSMEGESDRGCLLVGLAEISDGLGELLTAVLSSKGGSEDANWLLDPTAGNRPIGSLAIRTRVAVCLGLIDDERRKIIDALRSLRNTHAHGTKTFTVTEHNIAPIVKVWPINAGDTFRFLPAKWPTRWDSAREQLTVMLAVLAEDIRRKKIVYDIEDRKQAIRSAESDMERQSARIAAMKEKLEDLSKRVQPTVGNDKGDEPSVS